MTSTQRLFGPTRTHGEFVVYCFPDAGSGAGAFAAWQRAFPPSIEIRPLRLPGREDRIAEPFRLVPAEIADGVAARADRPYAFYGHSMGARLAFEVVRELRRRGDVPLPVALYVGAAQPPDAPVTLADAADLPDDQLVTALITRTGARTELRDLPELRELVLPVIRADLRWVRSYRYQPQPPLPVPVVAFAGAADQEVGPLTMLGWVRQAASGFRLYTVPGGHPFHRAAPQRLVDQLSADFVSSVKNECPPLAVPADGEVHVFQADLDSLAELPSPPELSVTEARRAARFRGDLDRRRYVARTVLLRRLLRRYGVDLGTAELPTRPGGKPHLRHETDLRFSLSHSRGILLIAVTAGRDVGVDVERLAPMADFGAFCDGALHPDERAELSRLPPQRRVDAALRIWTAKEAVLKATGDGLAVEPSLLSFAGQTASRSWHARVPSDLRRLTPWRVTHLSLAGAVGAVAVDADSWRLRFETLPG